MRAFGGDVFRFKLLVLLLVTFSNESRAKDVFADVFCKAIARYAEVVMTTRQEGQSLQRQLEVHDRSAPEKHTVSETHMIIIEAYKTPRFQSSEIIADEIGEFRDRMHVDCLTQRNIFKVIKFHK